MHCFIFLAISKIGLTVGLHIVSMELVRLFLFPVLPYCVHDSDELLKAVGVWRYYVGS